MSDYLTIYAAARQLDISIGTVERLIDDSQLTAKAYGSERMVMEASLQQYARRTAVELAPYFPVAS